MIAMVTWTNIGLMCVVEWSRICPLLGSSEVGAAAPRMHALASLTLAL